MVRSLVFELQQGRARADLEAVQSWRSSLGQEIAALEVAELVQRCLHYPEEIRTAWAFVWELVQAKRVDDYDAVGNALTGIFDDSLATIENAQELTEQLEQQGTRVAGSSRLPAITADLRRMKSQALDNWPWFSEADSRRAIEEHARGECIPIEETIRAIQARPAS